MAANRESVAVIGAGVAGLTAAYVLQRKYNVTLFESRDYAGGHTHTVTLARGDDAGTPVDTGFIVMNDRNYPLLTRLLSHLGVALRDSDMSFSYCDADSGLQYSGSSLNALFAQRRNLFRPSFHRMIREILRFFKESRQDMEEGRLAGLTLGQYLESGRYSEAFVRHHVIPMGSAIWSTPSLRMLDFPAENFITFFRNHGLLSLKDRPQWKTIKGGSHTYVDTMLDRFDGRVLLNTPVKRVRRDPQGVGVTAGNRAPETFDRVVIAAHADQALAILEDPSDTESKLLGAWRYQRNRVVLHSDASVMPPLRKVWASWNYVRESGAGEDGPATLSYDMTRLQGLETQRPYFVTLNRQAPIAEDRIVVELEYDHPTYTSEALASQAELSSLNGARRTHFCGSYFGYGFHEDAVRSAFDVVRGFGLGL